MEEIGVKEDPEMFIFWKKNGKKEGEGAAGPKPNRFGDVGNKGVCPSGEPVDDRIPLEQLLCLVPKGERYSPTTIVDES